MDEGSPLSPKANAFSIASLIAAAAARRAGKEDGPGQADDDAIAALDAQLSSAAAAARRRMHFSAVTRDMEGKPPATGAVGWAAGHDPRRAAASAGEEAFPSSSLLSFPLRPTHAAIRCRGSPAPKIPPSLLGGAVAPRSSTRGTEKAKKACPRPRGGRRSAGLSSAKPILFSAARAECSRPPGCLAGGGGLSLPLQQSDASRRFPRAFFKSVAAAAVPPTGLFRAGSPGSCTGRAAERCTDQASARKTAAQRRQSSFPVNRRGRLEPGTSELRCKLGGGGRGGGLLASPPWRSRGSPAEAQRLGGKIRPE